MPSHVAIAAHIDDKPFFTETKALFQLLMRLNKAVRPVFEEQRRDGTVAGAAIDLVRMPWDGEGAAILGEIGELVARHARAHRRRWNPNAKRWEPIA